MLKEGRDEAEACTALVLVSRLRLPFLFRGQLNISMFD